MHKEIKDLPIITGILPEFNPGSPGDKIAFTLTQEKLYSLVLKLEARIVELENKIEQIMPTVS